MPDRHYRCVLQVACNDHSASWLCHRLAADGAPNKRCLGIRHQHVLVAASRAASAASDFGCHGHAEPIGGAVQPYDGLRA
ncbi:hypothetical protein ACM14_02675 [Delftia sp. JD2]|nr:hypothetical protein ACM14_02675 [Delftia sp. JD2]